MTDQQITELAAQIDHFDYNHGNYVRVYFKSPKNVDDLKQSLMKMGITDIIQAKSSIVSGGRVEEYMFELNYRYSKQKGIIDDLEQKQVRIKAWSILRGWGGIQMNAAEKAYFAKKDTELAAAKLKGRGK